ncbi:hypothetical protein DCC62_16930 [candidate division KSB1 bacterium]|nr:MAG: hypothetical protein DCC62_16930 [candidate division KSB1 bacterium]
MGKSNDGGGNNTADLRLYLDLSNQDQVALEFWIKDHFDETGPFDAIYFSNDSAQTFTRVFPFDPGTWVDLAWGKLPPIDVDGLAVDVGLELNNKFVISFRQMGQHDFYNNSGTIDGFDLDAIWVYDPKITYTTIPYSNGLEGRKLDNILTHAFPAYPEPGTSPKNFVRPGGLITIFEDASAPEGNWSMSIGRRYDGNTTTNALDLHLNLSGAQDVDLDFWIKDFYDEDHDEDGIFFSADGGITFKKVFDFKPESWNDLVWGKLPPFDVDRLATKHGLHLSDKFIIRFQQRDDHDFYNNSGTIDGFGLDLIKVYDPRVTYVSSFPFVDGFESGSFQSMWKWGNPFFPDTTARDGEPRIGGLVEVAQSDPRSGFYKAQIGRQYDGASTTNALDLHLNLLGAQGVVLSFWITDAFDETGPSDGLWLSTNGGDDFVRIQQFTPSSWNNFTYSEIKVRLDTALVSHALQFTDKCIVRFQQNGSFDFYNNSGTIDGFWIDDVQVTVQTRTAVDEPHDVLLPTDFALEQNYPTPFNPSTQISFALPSAQKVTLKVFDLTGKEVATLLQNEHKPAGVHQLTFDAATLSSGVYFYQLRAGEFVETKKMLLAR